MISTPSTGGRNVAIVGAGPAGLMAAERLAASGHAVTLYDRMASPGRKLLMAGRGGLNLTHSEPFEAFLVRYGEAAVCLRASIEAFAPADLRAWADGLGADTFVGSSGRVFPRAMKASPLLRAWLDRLGGLGVTLRTRHEWTGWDAAGHLTFATPGGHVSAPADAVLLALGGASWPRLGSNGGWVAILRGAGIPVADLKPANAGLLASWSEHFRERAAGEPLKRIAVSFGSHTARGEAVVTRTGLEGGAIYAIFPHVRDALERGGPVIVAIDLRPDLRVDELAAKLSRPRGKQSTASFLKRATQLAPVAISLLREAGGDTHELPADPGALAARIKCVEIPVTATAGLTRAISSAGGVPLSAVGDGFMLKDRPGVFVCGEMLDWEAPTGGYLLQGCFSTAVAAAAGMDAWLEATAGGRTTA